MRGSFTCKGAMGILNYDKAGIFAHSKIPRCSIGPGIETALWSSGTRRNQMSFPVTPNSHSRPDRIYLIFGYLNIVSACVSAIVGFPALVLCGGGQRQQPAACALPALGNE